MYILYFSCCVVDVTASYHNKSRDGQERLAHLFGNSRHVSARDAAVANGVNGGLAGSGEAVLRVNTLNTVGGVDVLDEGDLPAGSTTLAGSDGGGSKEVLPDLNNVSLMLMNLCGKRDLTRNHLLPYLASTFSRLPIQLRYHRQRVAE